jgi:hypothetical protein
MHQFPPWHLDIDIEFWAWLLIPPTLFCFFAVVILGSVMTGKKRLWAITLALVASLLWPMCLMPGYSKAGPAAFRTACRNNLKSIALAIHDYHDEHGRLPHPRFNEGEPPVSWRVDLMASHLRDFSGSTTTADYSRAASWDDLANLHVAQRHPQLFHCPANRAPQDDQQRWYTAYAFVTGPGTLFPEEGPLSFDSITDGMSATLLIVEACGQNIVWTEPRDVEASPETLRVNAPGDKPATSKGILSSYHTGGAQCALADGSARMISGKIDPEVLRALTTPNAGDNVGEF